MYYKCDTNDQTASYFISNELITLLFINMCHFPVIIVTTIL